MNINEETLEEAAERFYFEQSKSYEDTIEPIFDNSRYLVAGFIEGAKWMQTYASKQSDKTRFMQELEKLKANFNSREQGKSGCTYGDTEYDSVSAHYGFNEACSYFRRDIDRIIQAFLKEKEGE